MPIIKSKKDKNNRRTIKLKVNPKVIEQIEEYCQWAGIYDMGYFIEKAASTLYLNDEEWALYQSSTERSD